MGDPNPNARVVAQGDSYLALLGNLVGLLAAVLVLVAVVCRGGLPPEPPRPGPVAARAAVAPAPAPPAPEPAPRPAPRRAAPAPKVLDRAAVARAEGALDAASRDRARAEARADDA